MKLELTPEMTFEKMTEVLKEEFPQYKVRLLKNPLMRFQFIEVKKSGFVGVWVRVMKEKEVWLIKAIPSGLVRGLLGGLLLIAFLYNPQKKVQEEVAAAMKKRFLEPVNA